MAIGFITHVPITVGSKLEPSLPMDNGIKSSVMTHSQEIGLAENVGVENVSS